MKAAFEISTANSVIPFPETGLGMSNNRTTTATVLASIDPEVDVIFQMQQAFNQFIDSGQGWALLIGFFIGYLLRSLTAY